MPYSGIINGTEGADRVEVTVANHLDVPVRCEAALAHWYSDKLGRIAPGKALTVALWHDPQTGVLNLLNASEDRMPVEALWCSIDAARIRLDLPIAAGKMEPVLRYSCHADGATGLSCPAFGKQSR